MTWNPTKYLQFKQHRLQPALDLLQSGLRQSQAYRATLPASKSPATIHDLGCGPGNITPFLLSHFTEASLVGVDNSPEMIASAEAEMAKLDKDMAARTSYKLAAIQDYKPEKPVDVLYSNATLQWMTEHETLFPHLVSDTVLAKGGLFMAQFPLQIHEPSHQLIFETAAALPGMKAALEGVTIPGMPVQTPAFYHRVLTNATNLADLNLWSSTYYQHLPKSDKGENPVLDYVRGTTLLPVKKAVEKAGGATAWATFEGEYAKGLSKAYPMNADGSVLFPYVRLHITAIKSV